jgi:NADPH:quinone reductase-like Zn-dependent oxidoreductase
MSLVIYSASSADGTLAIKFARKSNIHPIIAIAGKNKDLVHNLIHPSQGDVVLGDRDGEASVVIGEQQTIQRLGLRGVSYAFDTIANSTSVKLVAQLVKSGGHLNVIGPRGDCSAVTANVKTSAAFVVVVRGEAFPLNNTFKHTATSNGVDFGYVYSRLFTGAFSRRG